MPKPPQKVAVLRNNPVFEADWCRIILDESYIFAPTAERDKVPITYTNYTFRVTSPDFAGCLIGFVYILS
jgi:hypothetical protein